MPVLMLFANLNEKFAGSRRPSMDSLGFGISGIVASTILRSDIIGFCKNFTQVSEADFDVYPESKTCYILTDSQD